jgi:Tfp pilus assembly PilM family ATPase
MLKGSGDSLLAIDLAPDVVRVLDVTIKRGMPTIDAILSGPLAEGGNETLPERQIDALEKIIETNRLKRRNCVATVPTNLVTTRSVMIDLSKPQSPEDQVKLLLQNISSVDAKDMMFDFWNTMPTTEGQRTYEVLVVASQKSLIHRYLSGFERLKLSCKHLDVSPCALASLLTRLVQTDSLVGTVVLGESLGYFAVVDKERVMFWRPFDLPAAKSGQQAGLERVGDEISKCVSHMVGTLHLDTMMDIYLFGSHAQDEKFGAYLSHRFNMKVKSPSPFEMFKDQKLPSELLVAMQAPSASQYAAALGLAFQPSGGING